jgi:hypothetical protein
MGAQLQYCKTAVAWTISRLQKIPVLMSFFSPFCAPLQAVINSASVKANYSKI